MLTSLAEILGEKKKFNSNLETTNSGNPSAFPYHDHVCFCPQKHHL